jgi:hypothetical protein
MSLVDGIIELGRRGINVTRYRASAIKRRSSYEKPRSTPRFAAPAGQDQQISHAASAKETFSTRLRDLVELRRDFIQANAFSVGSLDV